MEVTRTPDLIMSSRKWTPDAEVKCLECGKILRGHIRETTADYLGDDWDKWYCVDCLETLLDEERDEEYER